MSTHLFVPAMILGGVIISSLGAATMHFMEERDPTIKTVARDFIIGAIMMLMILQLLPESSEYMISVVMSLAPLSLFTRAPVQEGAMEMEVKVGVPNF